ncbi:Bromodomain [Phytophthora cactorum]|nr:Bromodomain [Phytophthora cactorum]
MVLYCSNRAHRGLAGSTSSGSEKGIQRPPATCDVVASKLSARYDTTEAILQQRQGRGEPDHAPTHNQNAALSGALHALLFRSTCIILSGQNLREDGYSLFVSQFLQQYKPTLAIITGRVVKTKTNLISELTFRRREWRMVRLRLLRRRVDALCRPPLLLNYHYPIADVEADEVDYRSLMTHYKLEPHLAKMAETTLPSTYHHLLRGVGEARDSLTPGESKGDLLSLWRAYLLTVPSNPARERESEGAGSYPRTASYWMERVAHAEKQKGKAKDDKDRKEKKEKKKKKREREDATTLQKLLAPLVTELRGLTWAGWVVGGKPGNPFLQKFTKENCKRLGVPNYFDYVKSPMDLTRMKEKVEHAEYTKIDQFSADIKLMAAMPRPSTAWVSPCTRWRSRSSSSTGPSCQCTKRCSTTCSRNARSARRTRRNEKRRRKKSKQLRTGPQQQVPQVHILFCLFHHELQSFFSVAITFYCKQNEFILSELGLFNFELGDCRSIAMVAKLNNATELNSRLNEWSASQRQWTLLAAHSCEFDVVM